MVWPTAVFPVPGVLSGSALACIKQNFSGVVLCSVISFPTWCQLFMKDSVAVYPLGLPECFL